MIKKEAEILGNDMTKIFLGGFSQGSFVSLYTSHVLKEKIGGVIIIGAFMSKVVEKLPEKEELPPTLVIHGLEDNMTKWENAERDLKTFLENPRVRTILIKDMKHDVYHLEAKLAIRAFLTERTK